MPIKRTVRVSPRVFNRLSTRGKELNANPAPRIVFDLLAATNYRLGKISLLFGSRGL
jgi:hypothetical protein